MIYCYMWLESRGWGCVYAGEPISLYYPGYVLRQTNSVFLLHLCVLHYSYEPLDNLYIDIHIANTIKHANAAKNLEKLSNLAPSTLSVSVILVIVCD